MTDAIPFGIYFAHTSVLRADVRARFGEWCYLQLQKRADAQSYVVHVAASYEDIRRVYEQTADEAVTERVMVSTITCQDFYRSCSLLSAPGMEMPTYVAPAFILRTEQSSSGADLQLVASSAWLCYFRVLRRSADGSVCVQVASLPSRLKQDGPYTATLSSQEFAQALPMEHRHLSMATCDMRDEVEEHAQAVAGRRIEHSMPERNREAKSASAAQLEPVYVPADIAQYAAARLREAVGEIFFTRRLKQKMWLQAALLALQSYRGQVKRQEIREAIDRQDHQIRVVLVNWLSGSWRLVEAEAVESKGQIRGYLIHIAPPVAV